MTNSQKNKFLFIMNYQNGLSREQKQFGLSSETPSVTYLLFVSFVNAKKDKLAMVFCSYCTHTSSYNIISVLNISVRLSVLYFRVSPNYERKVSVVKRSATLLLFATTEN